MKIVRFFAQNFQKINVVEITPNGNTVLITGKNGQGKSSILEAIVSAFRGAKYHPEQPIHTGKNDAEIVVETENYIIKRLFTEKGSSLVVTGVDSEGNKIKANSPQEMLDKIVGEVAFEPMSFIELGKTTAGKREQAEILKKLTGLTFDDINTDIEEVKQKRSEVKSSKELYEHEAARITVPEQTPDTEVDLAELNAELKKALEHNAAQQNIVSTVNRIHDEISRLDITLETEEKTIADLILRLEQAKTQHLKNLDRKTELQQQAATIGNKAEKDIDTAEIQSKIDSVGAVNKAVANKKAKADWLKQSRVKSDEFSALGEKLKTLEAKKAQRLAEAKMPIPGLSVTEDGVIYEGIPLNQVNDAKKLEIGVAMGMALNPKLRVIRLKGNDLDSESLAAVTKMVTEKDYQVWVERCDESGTMGIVIEDGSVATPERVKEIQLEYAKKRFPNEDGNVKAVNDSQPVAPPATPQTDEQQKLF